MVVEAIEKAVVEVGKYDADDWFVIAITVSARRTLYIRLP